MTDNFSRLTTFWNWPDDLLVSTRALSEAGFEYTGTEDEVFCQFCHVRIKHWKDDDIPLEKHVQYSPECYFIKDLQRKQTSKLKNNNDQIKLKHTTPTSLETLSNIQKTPSQSYPHFTRSRSHDERYTFSQYNQRHFLQEEHSDRQYLPRTEDTLKLSNIAEHYKETHDPYFSHVKQKPSLLLHEGDTRQTLSFTETEKPNKPLLIETDRESTKQQQLLTETESQDTKRKLLLIETEKQESKQKHSLIELETETKKKSLFIETDKQDTKQKPFLIQTETKQRETDNNNNHKQHAKQKPLTSETNKQKPLLKQVDYTIEANRVASFIGRWPVYSHVKPSDLVSAGLYYTGKVCHLGALLISGIEDRVVCAWCDGGIYKWEPGEVPLQEHAKHFPKCPFVIQKTRNINRVQFEEERQRASKIAGDMGFGKKIIRKGIQRVLSDPGCTLSASNLIQAINELEEESGSNSSSSDNGDNQTNSGMSTQQRLQGHGTVEDKVLVYNNEERNEQPKQTTKQDNSKTETNSSETSEEETNSSSNSSDSGQGKVQPGALDVTKLLEENLQLKSSTACKICMDNAVDTLFLPCRHLICCEECAKEVKTCPLCRTDIAATVKTYIS